MSKEITYFNIALDEECAAICKVEHSKHGRDRAEISNLVDREIGSSLWWPFPITKIEFETYQAFGIKEIKLTSSESPSEKL